MGRVNVDILIICLSVILASTIIGYAVMESSKITSSTIKESGKIISKTIKEKEMGTSEQAIKRLITEARKRDVPSMPPDRRERPQPGSEKVEGVTAAGNVVKGNPDAKVLMVEFSDFQCPFTKRFYMNSFGKIEKEYIENGKLKFVFRDFPLGFHPQAKIAAMACECAGRQDKYWKMFDKLLNASSLEVESLKEFAKDLKLNTKIFDKCLDNQQTKDEVENDFQEGQKFGVGGTPAFFINGRKIEGAMPFEIFKQIIDEELSK